MVFISVTVGPAAATVRHGCILELGEASRKIPVPNFSLQAVALRPSLESPPTKAVIATAMSATRSDAAKTPGVTVP